MARRQEASHQPVPRLADDMEPKPFGGLWHRCGFTWFRRTWVLQEVPDARRDSRLLCIAGKRRFHDQ